MNLMARSKIRQNNRRKYKERRELVRGHHSADDPKVNSACLRKKVFHTKKGAARAAAEAAKCYGVVFEYYHCIYCGEHHIKRRRDENGNPIPVEQEAA
jgi:hypothetical protein